MNFIALTYGIHPRLMIDIHPRLMSGIHPRLMTSRHFNFGRKIELDKLPAAAPTLFNSNFKADYYNTLPVKFQN